MKINRIGLIALVAQAALVLALGQQARADDKPITLARAYKVGDVVRHKLAATISVGGMEVKLEEVAKSEVKELKPDGNIVFEGTMESAHLSTPGGDQDLPQSPARTETRTKYGKLVEMKQPDGDQAPMTPEVQKIIAILTDVIFPEKPVKSGDGWETSFDNPAVKEKKFTVKGTYLGTEAVDGKDLWKVKQTADVATSADPKDNLTYDTTYYLDPTNGQVVKASMIMKNIPSNYGTMDWDGQLTVVKAAEKAAK